MFPTRSITLHNRPGDDAPTAGIACRVEGDRVVRTAGLGGDELVVFVRAADWPYPGGPVGWGLNDEFELRAQLVPAGEEAAPANSGPMVWRHYYLRQVDPVSFGADDQADGPAATVVHHEVKLRFLTLPGVVRGNGRGGVLRIGTLNPQLSSGEADITSIWYRGNRALVNLCVDALDFTAVSPAGLDDVSPPSPLDWGNANAVHELEALLARTGYEIALPNSGTVFDVYRVPRSGEPDAIVLDSEIEDALSTPLKLFSQPGLRADTIIVTSGDTRATVLTWRDIAALEWVWFDPKATKWKNASQTASGTLDPDDLAAFKAGPNVNSADGRAEYDRLFKALRLTGDDAELRPVQAWEAMTFADGTQIGSAAAFAVGYASVLLTDEVFALAGGGGTPANFGACEVHPEAGVFVLPKQYVYLRNAAGNICSGRGELGLMAAGTFRIYFAHEASYRIGDDPIADSDFARNYFAVGYKVTESAGELVFTELTAEQLEAALVDPRSIKVHQPALRRIVRHEPGSAPVEVNLPELKAIALEIAKARGGLTLSRNGSAFCVGWIPKDPGCCNGACSRIEWDLGGFGTGFTLNDHETPDGFMDERANDAKRSFASGMNRWVLPGSAASLSDIKSQTTPGMPMTPGAVVGGSGGGGATGGNSAETAAGSRGLEQRLPVAGHVAQTPGNAATDGGFKGSFFARITAATALGSNRWKYAWEQVVPDGSTEGAWRAVAGGWTHSTHGYLYNMAEAPNDGAGIEGNGVDRANLPGGWAMRPIALGVVVHVLAQFSGTAFKCGYFSQPNADDGACVGASGGGGETGGEIEFGPQDGAELMLDAVAFDRDGGILVDRLGQVVATRLSSGLSISDRFCISAVAVDRDREVLIDRAARAVVTDASGVSNVSGDKWSAVAVDRNRVPVRDRNNNLVSMEI